MTEPRILLARDTGTVRLDVGPEAICVCARGYAPPTTGPGCAHMDFAAFEADPRGAMAGRSTLVLVGLSRAMTPSNRTREVWEILFNASRDWHKVSIDRTLFVAEPWRAWFHWGFVGAPYREYTYSYLAESRWQAHRDGMREEDPFGLAEVQRWGAGLIRSGYRRWFGRLDVETVAASQEVHAAYQEAKAAAFDEESTLAGLLKRLGAFAQQACPRRAIPQPGRLFDRTTHRIVATDLPIDRFLLARLWSLVELTDGIGAAFHGR